MKKEDASAGGGDLRALFRREAIEGRRLRYTGVSLIRDAGVTIPATIGLVLVSAAALTYVLLTPIPQHVRAVGMLSPSAGTTPLLSDVSGRIREVRASSGDRVTRGQVVAVVERSLSGADGVNVDEAEVAGAVGQQAFAARDIEAQVAANELAILEARSEARSAQTELADLRATRALTADRLRSAEARLERYGPLVEKGFASLERQQNLSDGVLDARLQLAAADRAVRQQETRVDIARTAEARASAEARLLENAARQTAAAARTRAVRVGAEAGSVILAPVSGVLDSPGLSVGSYASPGSPVGRVVPVGEMEAWLLVPTRQMSNVQIAQDVRIELDAYPSSRYGQLAGKVKAVASTATVPDDLARSLGVSSAYYLVRIALDAQHVRRLPPNSTRAGLSLTGRVQAPSRSLVDLLFRRRS